MIRVKNLYKKYSQEYLYKDFDISIEENKITSIIGASGCGKTTLFKILAGLEDYEDGNIEGLDKKRIAFIFQEDRLIPWLNIYENIRFVLKSHMEDSLITETVDSILQAMKLEDYKHYMPNELSGGMRRRVAIGRAFAYPCEILLMDEPFKGLDPELKKEIINIFLEMWRLNPKTVIFITHQIDEAETISHHIVELYNKPIKHRKIK